MSNKPDPLPKFLFVCQHGDGEWKLLGGAIKHEEDTGHAEFFMHINGVTKK